MTSSTRRTICCLLVLLGAGVSTRSQIPATKDATASITGKVTIKGKAAAGVTVGVRRASNGGMDRVASQSTTDEQGIYRLTNLEAGSYVVVPSTPAYTTSEEMDVQKQVIVNKGEAVENIDFALLRGGVITGKITDSEGRPVIEEPVFLMPVTNSNIRMEYRYGYGFGNGQNHTDDRGVYRIYGLPPGRYKVAAGQTDDETMGRMMGGSAYKRVYYPNVTDIMQATVVEVSEGSEATGVDITVNTRQTTYKILNGENGQPVPNVGYGLIRYQNEHSTSTMTTGAVTNNQGDFKFQGLAPGKYGMFINNEYNGGQWYGDPIKFEVTDQDVSGLVAKAVKGTSSISGVLVLEGTPDKAVLAKLQKAGLRVYAMKQNDGRNDQGVPVNPDNSFRVSGLPGGVFGFVLANSQELRIARVERDGVNVPNGLEVKDGEQIGGVRLIVYYGNATLRGSIKFENGTPPANSRLYCNVRRITDDPNSVSTGNAYDSFQVDARGQFIREGLMPGTYEIMAGAYSPGVNTPTVKQQVIVTAGSVTNVTLTIDLSSNAPRP
jgi:5-hydroxyisourate hydrolase-like protein (transthyretin family)